MHIIGMIILNIIEFRTTGYDEKRDTDVLLGAKKKEDIEIVASTHSLVDSIYPAPTMVPSDSLVDNKEATKTDDSVEGIASVLQEINRFC